VPAPALDPIQDAEMSSPPLLRSLSAKLLVLTALFVMLAEVLIFLPSIARFRVAWLEERLALGHLAALTIEAAPNQMVTEGLEQQLLAHVGADMIDLELPDNRIYMLAKGRIPEPEAEYDLREQDAASLIAQAVKVLIRQSDRTIRIVGTSPKTPDALVTLVLPEAPMAAAMLDFAGRILLLSIVISLITATLVFLSLNGLLVRPMRRITASMVAFREHPEGKEAALVPGTRRDEIGTAERELLAMQEAVRAALRQQSRLAALGSAVARINHDLRNILSSAALVSERLAASGDPEVRRVTPRLMQTLDRAADLCARTLVYARGGELPISPASVSLAALAREAGEALGASDGRRSGGRGEDGGEDGASGERRWRVDVADGLTVEADRDQLFRVLLNLGRNAFEAGAGTVTLTAREEAGGTVVEVGDDGPGLAPRARENLFRPFAGSAHARGTGLGLAIASEIVRAHGGDIRLVESTARGTRFAFCLPARALGR
jgi:signal transduction histidine kinase